MTVEDILTDIEMNHSSAWYFLFTESENGHCYYPTGAELSRDEYERIRQHFAPAPESEPAPTLTPEQRRLNTLRSRAGRYDHGGRYAG